MCWYFNVCLNVWVILEVNWDLPSLLRVFSTLRIPTQVRNGLTNSKVKNSSLGRYEQILRIINDKDNIHHSIFAFRQPKASIENADRGATLYRWWSTWYFQFAGLCHLIWLMVNCTLGNTLLELPFHCHPILSKSIGLYKSFVSTVEAQVSKH